MQTIDFIFNFYFSNSFPGLFPNLFPDYCQIYFQIISKFISRLFPNLFPNSFSNLFPNLFPDLFPNSFSNWFSICIVFLWEPEHLGETHDPDRRVTVGVFGRVSSGPWSSSGSVIGGLQGAIFAAPLARHRTLTSPVVSCCWTLISFVIFWQTVSSSALKLSITCEPSNTVSATDLTFFSGSCWRVSVCCLTAMTSLWYLWLISSCETMIVP